MSPWNLRYALLAVLPLSASSSALGSEPLPGPGLEIPVDVDGDGTSTYGDRYAFNFWLELGGSLEKAVSEALVKGGDIIDLSVFFKSSKALLKSRELAEAGEPAGVLLGAELAALSGPCPTTTTSARVIYPYGTPTAPVADPPSDTPTQPPAYLLAECLHELDFPSGAEVDALQWLWFSRHGAGNTATEVAGVGKLNLTQVPPLGRNGTIPLSSPQIHNWNGFIVEAMTLRVNPPYFLCPENPVPIHALTTWADSYDAICRTAFDSTGWHCAFCPEIRRLPPPPPEPPVPLPDMDNPFALDVVRAGMPADFGPVDDIVFSIDYPVSSSRRAKIRTLRAPEGCDIPLTTLTTLSDLAGNNVVKVWGLALGDFKKQGESQGTGVFAAYCIVQLTSGNRHLRRLRNVSGTYSLESFGSLPQPNTARAIEFDPISGDLFVSEEGSQARIFRFDKDGVRSSFGDQFKDPNGLAFHPSGVLLVTEDYSSNDTDANILVVGGWRNLFKRGDANGDGTVDVSDPVFIWNYVNQSGPHPPCLDGADGNDDSQVLSADGQLVFDYLFSGGPAPLSPGPSTCGRDPTPDLLDCTVSLGVGCPILFTP